MKLSKILKRYINYVNGAQYHARFQLVIYDACFSVNSKHDPGALSPKLYVDGPAGPRKFDFLQTNFSHNYPPISTPFSKKKNTQFCSNCVLFTIICSKYTQFMSFGLIHLWWKPTDRNAKFREIAPQKVDTYTYTMSCQCENPQHNMAVLSRNVFESEHRNEKLTDKLHHSYTVDKEKNKNGDIYKPFGFKTIDKGFLFLFFVYFVLFCLFVCSFVLSGQGFLTTSLINLVRLFLLLWLDHWTPRFVNLDF